MILVALGAALVLYQRRFLALHRRHAVGLLRAQEEERAWVAREVHDDALQRIAVLLQDLDGWRDQPEPTRVDAHRAEIEDLSVVLRRLAYRLHPPMSEQDGLVPPLRRLATDLSRSSGIPINVTDESESKLRLTPEQLIVAYRIVQEALSNLIKHAKAPAGTVLIRTNGRLLDVVIEDQGAGFDTGLARNAGGLGLVSMAERARAVGGTLTVFSEPGQGTRVQFQLPREVEAKRS